MCTYKKLLCVIVSNSVIGCFNACIYFLVLYMCLVKPRINYKIKPVSSLSISCVSVVSGTDRGGVLSAKTRISLLVDSARTKQPFTHFLSIPVNTPDILDAFATFQETVLETCKGVSRHRNYFLSGLKTSATFYSFGSKVDINLHLLYLRNCSRYVFSNYSNRCIYYLGYCTKHEKYMVTTAAAFDLTMI